MSDKKFYTDVSFRALIKAPNLTASRALKINASGVITHSTVSETELEYLVGVTSAIQTQLNAKIDKVVSTNNAVVRFDGIAGSVQDSGVTIDDSNNVAVPGNLTVTGDLTVNGTTTTINTTVLEVEDANILVNKGGDQASANSQGAGFTVEMSDATDAAVSYDSTLTSKFKIGEIGAQSEIVDIDSIQVLENKEIDGTSATGNNTVTTDADQVTYERSDISKKNIQAASDEVEAALSDLDDAIGALDATPTNYSPVDAGIVADHLAAIDSALAGAGLSPGDIANTTFAFNDDQSVAADVTGLAFANASIRSAVIDIAIERGATFESLILHVVQKSASWDITVEGVGDDTGVSFSITSSGQIQYVSSDTGTAGDIIFRARALQVA